jgi:DNA polymerase-3 subunit beta
MDVIITRKDFVRILECYSVTDKKSPQPVLANVLLTAERGRLTALGTDLYLSMTDSAPAEVTSAGSIALPAKDLFDRVKAMPEGPVQLRVDGEYKASIRSIGGKRWFDVCGLSPADFPEIPKPADMTPWVLPVDVLRLLVARTHFSISGDETAPSRNSALFEWKGNLVRMVSTDGHRLSWQDATVPGDAVTSMLFPLAAIVGLRRFIEKETSDISIRRNGTVAFFGMGDAVFACKLADAQFPPYEMVVPRGGNPARVRRDALTDALKAVQLAASDRTGGVKLSLVPGALRITSEGPDSGAGGDELAADYSGPETQIGVNSKYVLDVLGAVAGEEVDVTVGGPLDPIVIRPSGDTKYTAVIMPMKL